MSTATVAPLKISVQSAINLAIFAIVVTVLLAVTFNATKDIIAENEKQAKLKLIGQILPTSIYDNDLITDTLTLPANRDVLGTQEDTVAYRARKAGEPAAIVLESVAPDGYSGNIKLIVSILANGEISGVRVVSHKETPGLGDYIEITKDKWITQFAGKSLDSMPERTDWKVRKDGGKFDYVAGATVTPRAVVKAVYKTAVFVKENKEKLFAPSAAGDKK